MNLTPYFEKLATYLSLDILYVRIGAALLMIMLTLLLRHFLVKRLLGVLQKLAKKTRNTLDDRLFLDLKKPAGLLVPVIGFWIGINFLELSKETFHFTNQVFRSLITISLFWLTAIITDTLSDYLKVWLENPERAINPILPRFIRKAAKFLLGCFAAFTLFDQWGFNISSLLAGLGLGGLAFALAAQNTLSNFFGSITLMLDSSFKIGDWIKTPDIEGVVEELGFRSTKIRTFTQALVTVPNSTLGSQVITNFSRMDKRQMSFKIKVSYDSEPARLNSCIEELRSMLKSNSSLDPEALYVYLDSFGDSALEILFYFFTQTTRWQEYLGIKEKVLMDILSILKKHQLKPAIPSASFKIENMDRD